MSTVSCEFRLAADKDGSTLRTSFVDITGSKNRGTWKVTQQSEDGRLKLPVLEGSWDVHADSAGDNTGYLFDKDLRIHLFLHGLPRDVMSHVTCGFSWAGAGLRTIPPDHAIVYKLSFLCA